MLHMLAEVFSDVLKVDAETPESWKQTRMKVLFKKGDPRQAENYRPISILPIIYKLFSKVLCGKVRDILLAAQSVDQAGFRSGFSCDDHLFTIALLVEMHGEYRLPLWVVAVDFRKAFDTLNHRPLWTSLLEQGVPHVYVNVLMRLYSGQTGQVQTDCLSKPFPIKRGVRQGDPISPILFNAAIEKLMRNLKQKWSKNKWGLKLEGPQRLQNLRFADDLLLIGCSQHQAKSMLADLIAAAGEFGLEVHEGKTKFLWNGIGRGSTDSTLEVEGKEFEVLATEASTMYLGRLLSLHETHDIELKNRMAKGWAKFAIYRDELTSRCYSLRQRMRLFTSVIQPSVLYGCVAWTPTKQREALLRTTQRRMMRQILGAKRIITVDDSGNKVVESYVEWIVRATRELEEAMAYYNVCDWVEEACRRRFRWAGHVCRREDGRWSRKVLKWQPVGTRYQGRPLTRWSDAFDRYFEKVSEAMGEEVDWMTASLDRDSWRNFEDSFVQFCLH